MTYISPTRVSMYDFLYQDIQPTVSLLADITRLSLPQTRLVMDEALQAILSALLAYQQAYGGQAVCKKLFARSAIKELRQYNSMNFKTINAAFYHRHDVTDALFGDSARVAKASERISARTQVPIAKVQILLCTLGAIALRELAILAHYSRLDFDEVDTWFALQPQFLYNQKRGIEALPDEVHALPTITCIVSEDVIPPDFDRDWHTLTGFNSTGNPAHNVPQSSSHYLTAIGRSPNHLLQNNQNDMLMFLQIPNINVPHQRWLVQLAKVSDIYLSRNRLRINSEPATPPAPPLVSLALLSGINNSVPNEQINHDEAPNPPLWRHPVILLVIVVIGILGALATVKYQMKNDHLQPQPTVQTAERTAEH
ncbi:hypothetical protein [Psychrobacter aestuarii]|uniref:Uncharacterized protein n=1 Tax=Psychrobacter aestuarii TaxID=556327 RepID=A0ABN0VMM7_9GAMM|nr:hypothetical protein [Psychrobacter aestuarii]